MAALGKRRNRMNVPPLDETYCAACGARLQTAARFGRAARTSNAPAARAILALLYDSAQTSNHPSTRKSFGRFSPMKTLKLLLAAGALALFAAACGNDAPDNRAALNNTTTPRPAATATPAAAAAAATPDELAAAAGDFARFCINCH